jgi:hypothetical protein
MAEQTEALRLADALEEKDYPPRRAAAAELRRLHALNAQLLDALETLVGNEDARSWGVFGVDNRSAFTKARAAIAAAKEKNNG